MERREFVAGIAATAVGLVASSAARADAPGHAGHKMAPPSPPISKELRAIIDATSSCEKTGQVCLAHCTELLATGDTTMADCQRGVMNMLAVCDATFKAASYHSADPKNLKALARVCAEFCRTCAKACEPHAGHHEECKACMESCNACAKACDAYAA